MFKFDYPSTIQTYGPVLQNIQTTLALKEGFAFFDVVTIAPNKLLKYEDIEKGEPITSYVDGNDTAELFVDEHKYMIVVRRFSVFDENDDDDDDVPTNATSNEFIGADENNVNLDKFKVVTVSFFCKTREYCAKFKAELLKALKEIATTENQTRVTFWYNSAHGPRSYNLVIDTPPWSAIKRNYSLKLQDDLDRLINYDLDANSGSIALLHGPAGTGKTYFIRSLLNAWKSKCQINYVIDTDSLFNKDSADYLVNMICLPKSTGKYNVLIMEDSGELLAKDAKLMMGQAMSRMLNISDGILGQGSKNFMLISTNEELNSLNDAISRPGRCFAKLLFDNLSQAESNSWLYNNDIGELVTEAKSLAQLYEILNNRKQISNKQSNRIGF